MTAVLVMIIAQKCLTKQLAAQQTWIHMEPAAYMYMSWYNICGSIAEIICTCCLLVGVCCKLGKYGLIVS